MMDGIPGFDASAQTWLVHSFILIIAVYFRFTRIWSVRNLDLALLLALSPILYLSGPEGISSWGPMLVVISGLLLLRLLADGKFERRPRLEQNLNLHGLAFLCCAAYAVVMANVNDTDLPDSTVDVVSQGAEMLSQVVPDPTSAVDERESVDSDPIARDDGAVEQAGGIHAGPTTTVLAAGASQLTKNAETGSGVAGEANRMYLAAKILAVAAHTAVVAGLILVGLWHFGELRLGVAMATMYLLLPCTAFEVHEVTHVLPAALIVWAVVAYRRPMVSGSLLGLACGTLFFTVFLLPLWAAFYGRKGAIRFGLALVIVGAVLMGTLSLTAADSHTLTQRIIGTINWTSLQFHSGTLDQSFGSSYWRVPMFAGFVVMLVMLTVWPRRKNVENLLAHSTAIVVATQLWYPEKGGMYVLWYLPLLLLVVFRPRLNRLLPPEADDTEGRDIRVADGNSRQLAPSNGVRVSLFR